MGNKITRGDIREFRQLELYLATKGEFYTKEGVEDFLRSCHKDFTVAEQKKLMDFLTFQFTGNIPANVSEDKQILFEHLKEIKKSSGKASPSSAVMVKEVDSKSIKDLHFSNWGRTVKAQVKAFYPQTKADLLSFVRDNLKDPNFKVRCSGFRHSWSHIFPDEGQHLVSLLPEWVAKGKSEDLLKFLQSPTIKNNEFYEIKIVGNNNGKPLVRMGAGVTNEQLRQWSLYSNVSLPLNVIMVEINIAGSNATHSHGSGIGNKTLSDLVYEIEFINAKGNLQKVSKKDHPELISTAAGAMGLLGIVASLTLELVPQQIARFIPQFLKMEKAIPSPSFSLLSEKQAYIKSFNDLCANRFYSEWFWFIEKDDVYINAWNVGPVQSEVPLQANFPTKSQAKIQAMMSSIVEGLQDMLNKYGLNRHKKLRKALAKGFSTMALASVPSESVDTYLSEALHFQRGIQNFTVRDFEVEIEIPKYDDGGFDFDICRKAWWIAVEIIKNDEAFGINLALEMRIFGGSNVTMAPEYGYPATCSIEVLSNLLVPENIWQSMMNKFWHGWSTIKDKYGKTLKTRPHWGKEWESVKNPDGSSILSTLKESYKEQIAKFTSDIQKIGQLPELDADKWNLSDAEKRFSNNLLNKIVFH